jgi:hypothetical protein
MPKKYGSVLASSQDPTGQTLSQTIKSLGNVAIGALVFFGASKGFNVATAQTQLQSIIDLAVQIPPIAFALWNVCKTLEGALMKFWSLFKKSPVTTIQPVVVVPNPTV